MDTFWFERLPKLASHVIAKLVRKPITFPGDTQSHNRCPLLFIGNADHGRLNHSRIGGENRFYLRRSQPFPSDFQSVIAAAQNEPVPIAVAFDPISVNPQSWTTLPISFQIAIG